MTATNELRHAARDAAPLLIALVPFGAIFGAFAIDAGLTVAQALGFSAFVYAGASQLLALELIGLGAPLWSILLAVVALNFRHVLYSASIGRHLDRFGGREKSAAFFLLVDPLFAAAEARVAKSPLTKRYYFLYGLVLYSGWVGSTALGALFGGLVGDQRALGLDLVLPVYFLAQTMAFRQRGGFFMVAAIAALVSMIVYVTLGSPWHVTLGGAAGIAFAALRGGDKGRAAEVDGSRPQEPAR